jgi:TetR/AcrR family transcriptional regulator, mexCD-oprJ operon repressor
MMSQSGSPARLVNRVGRRPRAHTAALEAATKVLAENPKASMGEIAAAAGIGRATLYRAFPTRECLMDTLAFTAATELAKRIEEAGLDLAPVPEALHRLLRAVLTVANHYVIIVGTRPEPESPVGRVSAEGIEKPFLELVERGVADGTLRADLGTDVLLTVFGGLVVSAIDVGLPGRIGIEQTAALLGSALLDGIAGRA